MRPFLDGFRSELLKLSADATTTPPAPTLPPATQSFAQKMNKPPATAAGSPVAPSAAAPPPATTPNRMVGG